MRYTLIILVVLMISCQPDPAYRINISEENRVNTPFIGHGAQWSAYHHGDCETAEWGHLMTDEKWQMNFDRLDFMKPRIFRVLDQANWRYLKGFTPEGEAILDFESPEMQAMYKLLDYCESRGITVLLGEWGSPYKVHDLWKVPEHFKLTGADDPVWIDMILKHLDHLVNKKGYTCIKYYNLVNEPNGYWAGTDGNWEQWSNGLKMLHKGLVETGLDKQISIAGPDAVPGKYNSEFLGSEWLEKSVDELNDFIGCYDVHAYPKKEYIFSGEFAAYYKPLAEKALSTGKPIVFGELGSNRGNDINQERIKNDPHASTDSQMEVYDFSYGIQMADACIQAMNMGFGGIMVWDLDDAMHTSGDTGDKSQLKRWGMWNSLGTDICNDPADENIRPWFFPWSLMCRYFLPGSEIIKVESGNEGLHVVASVKDGNYTIAFSNNTSSNIDFTLISDENIKLKGVNMYVYEEDNFLTDDEGFPLPLKTGINFNLARGENISIKQNSVVLFTSISYE
ncbi:cellulase family glycosylhydrolase [Bacteroidota bacterium]